MAPTGQVLHDLARALVHAGHSAEVVASQRSYDGGRRYPATETIDGVRIRRVPACGFGRRSFAGKLADYASFYCAVAGILCLLKPRPDIILSLTTPPYAGILGKAVAALRGCRHAHWIMDLYPDVMAAHGMLATNSWLYRALAYLTRKQLSGSSLVLTLGPDMEEKVRHYVNRSTTEAPTMKWIPLWGDPSLVPWPAGTRNPLRSERGWGDDDVVFMYSGNMGLGHRFGEFLAAAAQCRHESGIRWVFAGGGKRCPEIASFRNCNPDVNLELLDYVARNQLRAHLCSGDVHLASLDPAWQGTMVSSKIQGIFAVGRPVIFVGDRRNSLANWINESGGGWVVAPDNIDALVTAVHEATSWAERERRSHAARAYAEQRFDPAGNTQQIIDAILNAGT